MKTISSPLAAALAAPVQQPAWLVEMHFGTVQRWSSMATVTWNGHTWARRDMRVDGLNVQPFKVGGSLVLGNEDDGIGTLLLTEGAQDRRIVVYGYDAGGLTGTADVVWLCDAVGSAAQLSETEARIALRHRSEFVQSPRTYVAPAAGFTQLLPADTVLRINGIDMRLERRT
jgi:hypothetical protein